MPLIEIENLTVVYDRAPALADVNFNVNTGDFTAIIGPNGAGKSTLIQAIMGLIQPRAGTRISIEGGRERLGYVPQHNDVDWDFPVTVEDVVMMGLTRQVGWLRWPGRKHWRLVHSALDRVGLRMEAHRPIGDLSGGQRRRAFIARSLAQNADVLLLDEPFAGVDINAQAGLMDTLHQLNAEGITIILSTHDLNLAFEHFQRVVALNGRLVAYGTPSEVAVPHVLRELYGGAVATWQRNGDVVMVVDDHGCNNCG